MAIWRRARDIKSGECSVRTRAILDDDAFLECHTELLGDDTANRIAGAAGAEYCNEGDRLAGIVVGEERRAEQCRRCGHENETQLFHAWFLSGYREFLFAKASVSRSCALSICAVEHSRSRQPLRPALPRRRDEHLSQFAPSARCRAPWPRRRCARAGARYRPRSQQARRNWGSAR